SSDVCSSVCNAVFELDAYDGSAKTLSAITLDDDNVFGDDGGEHQLATISGDTDSGYVASLDVPVDTETEPSGGAAPAGGGGGEGGERAWRGSGPACGTPPDESAKEWTESTDGASATARRR